MAERSTESTAKLTEAKAKAEARDKCKKFSSASPGIDWIGIPMKGLRFFRRRWTRQTDPRGTQPASQPARQPDSQTVRRTDRTRSLGQSSQWTQSAQRSSSPWYTLIAPPTALSPGSGLNAMHLGSSVLYEHIWFSARHPTAFRYAHKVNESQEDT